MPTLIRAGSEAAYIRRLAGKTNVARADIALAFECVPLSRVELFVEGREFYPPMLTDIEAAETSVHVVQFGFNPGQVGDRFAAALAGKARDGVPVRLVIDRLGSKPDSTSRELYARLVDAGAQVLINRALQLRAPYGPLGGAQPARWNFSNLGRVDHRKLVILDGETGWVGGAGFEDHFENGHFHDLFVRVKGPVVNQLQSVFLASLFWQGGSVAREKVPALFPKPEPPDEASPRALALHNVPGIYRPITAAITEMIDTARETLDVANPFVAHGGMVRRLRAAARRGVRVRLLVPAEPNNQFAGSTQRFYHAAMIREGIQIWEHPAMVHAKAFVRDGEEVLVGTCNLNAVSFKWLYEIDLRIQSPALAGAFARQLFEPDIAIALPARAASGFRERFVTTASAALASLL